MPHGKKFIGGLEMTWSTYAYVSDDNHLWMIRQWDFLADQLGYLGKIDNVPYARESVVPRYETFVEPNFGYRMNLVIPVYNNNNWMNQFTVGWFGYLYTAVRWFGEQPLKGD